MRSFLRFGPLTLLFLVVLMSACTSTKHIAYFQNIDDSLVVTQQSIKTKPIVPEIQPDDILLIQVNSPVPGAATMYNQVPSGSVNSNQLIGASSTATSLYGRAADRNLGYLVDSSGNINFPVLGTIHLGGLTIVDAQDTIQNRLERTLSNPLVNIRFLNYKITILGEVGRPGTYTIPNQQINLLEALGMAGDMTIFGTRTNVLVVREKDGVRKYGRINLNNTNSLFDSPFYHLQQGDVVYVEPRKSKVWSSDQAMLRNVSILVTILSALSIIATRF